jgi:hypothetical protein
MIVGIGGVPNSGKTTLVRDYALMGKRCLETVPCLRNGRFVRLGIKYHRCDNFIVLGDYTGDVFDGTDKLDMSVQPTIIDWIKAKRTNVLFEGARLFNRTFLKELPGLYIILDVDPVELERRRQTRRHNNTFLKTMETKFNNLDGIGIGGLIHMNNNDEKDRNEIRRAITEALFKPTVVRRNTGLFNADDI